MKPKIKINESGGKISLFSRNKTQLTTGYNRIVFGDRGPYIEINDTDMLVKNIHVPSDQLYRLSDLRVYYIEFRSTDDANVKIYYQLKTVSYADYKLGLFYISPYDLILEDGSEVATNSVAVNEKSVDFFE